MRSAVHGLLATDVEDMCSRLKYGSRQQRTATWQKLVSLEDGLDGDKIAKSGLVPVLVTMLEQVPSRRNPEVQNQAAALLFETAGSDAGMEVLVLMNCIPALTTALQSGSYVKQARVCAILGMISMCNQQIQSTGRAAQFSSNATMLSSSSIPEMIKVLDAAGCSDFACTAMILKALAAMFHHASPADEFVKAGGLEVLSKLLGSLSRQSSTFLLPSDGCTSLCGDQRTDDTAVWLAAVELIIKTAVLSGTGAQSILQGPLLYLLMQCCSSNCQELQVVALRALLSLAVLPNYWPQVIKAGQVLHLVTALGSQNPAVQQLSLLVIKALTPILSQQDESLLANAMEPLMGVTEDSNSVNGESLESCDDDSDEEDNGGGAEDNGGSDDDVVML